ncbi:hypothetical protein VKT23_000380 [Stygiomarasmius scandens]|uniref:Uncharacterized protein n=1 Tax=Marasmiellus scandens TaxID=2682957 RepID=A0ABR1IMB1_9AGAR
MVNTGVCHNVQCPLKGNCDSFKSEDDALPLYQQKCFFCGCSAPDHIDSKLPSGQNKDDTSTGPTQATPVGGDKVPSFLKSAKERLSRRNNKTFDDADGFTAKFDPGVKINAEAFQKSHSRPANKKRKKKTLSSDIKDCSDSDDDKVSKKTKATSNASAVVTTKFTVVFIGNTPAVDDGVATVPSASVIGNKFGANEAQFITIAHGSSASDVNSAILTAFTGPGGPFETDPSIFHDFGFLFKKANGRGYPNTLVRSQRKVYDYDTLKGLADTVANNGINRQYPLRLYIALRPGSPKISLGEQGVSTSSEDEGNDMSSKVKVADRDSDLSDPEEADTMNNVNGKSTPGHSASSTSNVSEPMSNDSNESSRSGSQAVWVPIIRRDTYYMQAPETDKIWWPKFLLGNYRSLYGLVERTRITLVTTDHPEALTQILKDCLRENDLLSSLLFIVELNKVMTTLSDSDFLARFCLGPFGLQGAIEVMHIIYARITRNKNVLERELYIPVLEKMGETAYAIHAMLGRFKEIVDVWEYAPLGFRQFFALFEDPLGMFDVFKYPVDDTEHYNFVLQPAWSTTMSRAWYQQAIIQDFGSADTAEHINPSKIRKGAFCLDAINLFMQEFLSHSQETQRYEELFALFALFCSTLAQRITQVVNAEAAKRHGKGKGRQAENRDHESDPDVIFVFSDNENPSTQSPPQPRPRPRPRPRPTAKHTDQVPSPSPSAPVLSAWERSLDTIRTQYVNPQSFRGVQVQKAFEAIYTLFNDGSRHPRRPWDTEMASLDNRKQWLRMCQIYHSDHAAWNDRPKYDKITALINEVKQEASF